MNKQYQTPIFCDNCSLLALATLDGAPLCLDCLQAALKGISNPKMFGKINPLKSEHQRQREAFQETFPSGIQGRYRHLEG